MTAVTVGLAVACTVLTALVVVVGVRVRRLRAALAATPPTDPFAGDLAIVIVVRNHLELAARRAPIARAVSALTPGIVRGIVHREVLREVRAALAEQGVVADVSLRRVPSTVRPPDPGAHVGPT